MAKSRGRKFAELVAPTNGVFAAASIPTLAISKLASSTFSVNSESASLGGNVELDSNDITEHSSALYFTNARAQASLSVAANSGHGALSYDNSNGQFTFAGITTEALQDVVGAMLSSNTETGITVNYQDSDGTIDLIVDDTTKVPLAGGTMTGNLTLGDNVNAYFGASTDLRIYHDGTNSHIINSTGELRVTGSNIAIKSDSAKLYFGASDDLQIYHDGSNSYISDTGTGDLIITGTVLRPRTDQFTLNNAANSENMINAVADGAVTLYYDGSAKLATTSTGVTVTGLTSMTTGVATSKFAVASTSVHGSYDFYNNGTSYFNGAVTVDDTLSANNVSILGTGILRVGTNQTWSNAVNPSSSIRLAYDGVERSITGHYTDGMSIRTNAHILRLATDGKVHFPAFTFPASDGSANQILQTNGSGTLSWVTNSGGSSVWSSSGSDIYYNSGNVAIGTTSASTRLDIKTANIGSSSNFATKAIAARMPLVSGYNNVIVSGLGFYDNTIHSTDIGLAYNRNSTGGYDLVFSTNPTTSGSPVERMTINADGLVGIGTTNPANPLHINSSDNQKIIFSGSNDPYIRWQEGTTNKGYMQWNAAGYFELRNEEKTSYWTLGDAFAVYPTTDEAFVIERAGSALRQHIKNTSTTGTYSYLQLSTVNSGSTQNSGYLIKNAAQNTGNSLGNDSLYLWNQTNEIEFIPAGTIAKRTTVNTNGDLTVRAAGVTGSTGIVGEAFTGYFGLRQIGQTKDSEYMILSEDNHTYISATTGYNVIIRNGGNNSTNQVVVGSGATGLSWRGNTVWTAENDGSGSGLDADTLDGQQGSYYLDTGGSYQRKGAGIQLGSQSTLTNASPTLSLSSPSAPYISFHNGGGTRTAYFQETSNRFYAGEVTYSETTGSYRAPLFYDVNNTAYYTDQASVSRMNDIRPDSFSTPASGNATMFVFGTGSGSPNHINIGGSSSDPAAVSNAVGISWGTRSDNNGYYLIGVHNYNNSYSTHSRLRIGWHTGLELGANATYGGVRIMEDSPYVNGTEQARFRGSGGIVFSRSLTDTANIQTPIFYDSANTSYYLDLNASGTALKMAGSINMDSTAWTGEIAGKIQYHSNQWYFQSSQGIFHFRNSSGTNLVYSDTSGNVFNTVSTRSPIFYDSANTSYYCDPASTTSLNTLTIAGSVTQSDNQQFRQQGYFRTNTSSQNTNSSADPYSFGYQEPGAWSHPYPDLIIGFHTGIQIGGHRNYNGTRFYHDHPENGSPTMIFSVGNGDDHIRATSNIYAYTSDKRLKENFRPIENALEKVQSLGGYIFDWREDMMSKYEFEPDQKKDDAGVIAQDVIKVMPAAVQRAPFDYDPNKKGHSKSGEEFMTVQYEKMVPLLIEAIKEQQEQIDQLKKLLEEKE